MVREVPQALGIYPFTQKDHAVAVTIREALKAKEEAKEKVILFNWSGHGLVDLAAYEAYLRGQLHDHDLPEEEMRRALSAIDSLPGPRQYRPPA